MGVASIGTAFTGALNDGQSAYLSSGEPSFIGKAQTVLASATAAVSTWDAAVQVAGGELSFGLNAVAMQANLLKTSVAIEQLTAALNNPNSRMETSGTEPN